MQLQFGMSNYFNPAPAAVGGALLGCCVMYKASLTGGILGISAYTRGLLYKGPEPSRVLFLSGMLIAGVCASFAGAGLEPPLSAAGKPQLWVRMCAGGFLVGFGTSLGNGCTSGHGLTGLARLGIRSWVGVPTFMGCAVLSATLSGAGTVFAPDAATEAKAPSWECSAAVAGAAAAILAISGASFVAAYRRRQSSRRLKDVSELFSGLLFGTGLLISGMARPSKVAGFVDVGSGAWDPSLMFVMCGALGVTFPFYLLVLPRLSEPLLGGDFSEMPNPRAMPDRELAVGTACFGIGWGLTGACPGPMWVLLGGRPSPPLLLFFASVYVGVACWVCYKRQTAPSAYEPLADDKEPTRE